MSGFHSTVSRRDFMKGLGLASAGLGGAAMVAPAFHDLDELMSSPVSSQKHAWFIKERELFNPTVDVDWGIMKRSDRRYDGQVAHIIAAYYGKERTDGAVASGTAAVTDRMKNNVSGWDHKWVALSNAINLPVRFSVTHSGPVAAAKGDTISLAKTPEELGIPKWTGTPEEGLRLLVAATRLYGASHVGGADLDDKWRNKLIIAYQRGTAGDNKYTDQSLPWPPPGIPIVYENVEKGYYTADKRVIPTKQMYLIDITMPEPQNNDRTAPSTISKNNRVSNSFVRPGVYFATWNFLRGLGYQSLGETGHPTDLTNHGASTVLTGAAESARQNNWVLSPHYGAFLQGFTQVTDLPVAPTKPIDAGMWRFCADCGKCADVCPPQVISHDKEPTYELPLIKGKPNMLSFEGPKHFWWDGAGCRLYANEWTGGIFAAGGCSLCSGNCVFSVGDKAMVHSVIKSTIATTGLFNSFFHSMSNTFGYGLMENREDWWDMALPNMGVDSTAVSSGR